MRIEKENSRLGFKGQIVTNQYDRLKEYCNTQELNVAQQTALKIFVKYLTYYKSKNISSYTSSYGLKHRVEELSERLVETVPGYKYEYIGNEDFIFAMLRNGFNCKNCGHGWDADRLGPNYFFNIKKLKKDWLQDPILELCVNEVFANETKYQS